jgi:pimeloyl-ACP methyl ester carboxylesterase
MTMRNLTMRTRLIASASALAIAATGFITVAPASANEVCTASAASCAGELPGGLGKYDVKVPTNFNGTVLVYFHGYKVSKNGPVPDQIAQAAGYATDPTYSSAGEGATKVWFGNGTAELTPGNSSASVQAFLAKGYALAGVGGGVNQGWAVQETAAAGDALIAKIRGGYVANTKRVIVWGNSTGGTIAQIVSERNKQVDAAVPFCAIHAGWTSQMRLATDVMYVMREIGGLPLRITYSAGQAGYLEAMTDLQMFLGSLQAIAANPAVTTEQFYAGVLKLPAASFRGVAGVPMNRVVLLAGLIAGVPESSKTYDGITTGGPFTAAQVNSMAAMTENFGSVAILGVLAKFESEQRARLGGQIATGSANFIDNVNTDYVARLDDTDLATYEFLLNIKADGTSDNTQLDRMLAKLASTKGVAAARLVGVSAAMAAIDVLPTPTGKVRVPTFALSAEMDPMVPAGNQRWLEGRVRAFDRASLNAWKVKVAEAKKAKKKKLPAKPAPRPLFSIYADAPDAGWTTFGAAGIDAAATAAKRSTGVGHCNGESNPATSLGQIVALVDAAHTWLTQGEKAGRASLNSSLNNAGLFFQSDPFWKPPTLKTLTDK